MWPGGMGIRRLYLRAECPSAHLAIQDVWDEPPTCARVIKVYFIIWRNVWILERPEESLLKLRVCFTIFRRMISYVCELT